jgi:phosphoglucosamine mutase
MGGLFGTDGVRGVANVELTAELAVRLGRALARQQHERASARPRMAIGRDPRPSSPMLQAAMTAGFCAGGGDVVPLGVLPTPGVAYATGWLGADVGTVISASHNPVADNGIKVFGRDGFKLDDADEQRVEQLLDRPHDQPPTGTAVGTTQPQPAAVAAYVDHLVAAADGDPSGLRVVVDCADGAASEIASAALARLGCDVTAIHADVDAQTVNVGCGSTHPEVVAAAVVEQGADLGLSLDGDADRLIAVDHTGAVVDGDQILAVLALRHQRCHGLEAVVTTVMTNLGFAQAMDAAGIRVIRTKVGDRHVLRAMLDGGHPLGGEQSGHLIITDHATTGDGVLTAVRLLSALAEAGVSLCELVAGVPRLPQVLVNVRGVDRDALETAEPLWTEVARVEQELGATGRVLLRASGTEPLVRVMVEADREDRAQGVADSLAEVVRRELPGPA